MREPFRNLGGIETANRSHTGKRAPFPCEFSYSKFFSKFCTRVRFGVRVVLRVRFREIFTPLPLGGCCPDEYALFLSAPATSTPCTREQTPQYFPFREHGNQKKYKMLWALA